MTEVGKLLGKIIDLITVIIKIVGLMVVVSDFLRIFKISLFNLKYPPMILSGFMWRLQKEYLISNSKIVWRVCTSFFISSNIEMAMGTRHPKPGGFLLY
jgi:hypothetical protein